jgi:S-adenosylmethionine synthetase
LRTDGLWVVEHAGELPLQRGGFPLMKALRESTGGFHRGLLEGHGPDGKLLVRLREDDDGWHLEHLLATVQHRDGAELLDFHGAVLRVARETYERMRAADRRWRAEWEDIETLISPNGPFIAGGSAGDNGQTGRKLVMDYYGPRVPIGGGALSGKHLSHVDRIGAYAAREAAVHAMATGAREHARHRAGSSMGRWLNATRT